MPLVELHPDQLTKVEPEAGVAVRVTEVLAGKFEEAVVQLTPQLMPEGVLTTVPVPVPALETVRE